MKKITFLFLLFQFISFSQGSEVDSLKTLILQTKNIDSLINYNNTIAESFYNNNWDSVEVYATKALKISKKNKSLRGELKSLLHLGNYYDVKGNFAKSKSTYDYVLENYNDSLAKSILLKTYKGLGNLYYYAGKIDSSIVYTKKCIKLAEEDNLLNYANKTKANLAAAFERAGRFEEALKLYIENLDYYSKERDNYNISTSYLGIGSIYFNMNQYEKAKENYDLALEYALRQDDLQVIAGAYGNLGLYYANKEDYDEFYRHMKKAKEYFTKANMPASIAFTDTQIVVSLMRQKKFSEAKPLIENLSNSKYISPEQKADIQQNYSRILFENKKYGLSRKYIDSSLAFAEKNKINYLLNKVYATSLKHHLYRTNKRFYKQYIAYDSLVNIVKGRENKEILNELEAKYQTAQKENEIKELTITKKQQELENEQQKKMLYGALGVAGILLLAGGGTFLYTKQKQKTKVQEQQKKQAQLERDMAKLGLTSLNNEIRTHDFKNTLSAALIEVQEKAPQSYQHIVDLISITETALYSDSFTDSLKNQFTQIKGLVNLAQNQLHENVVLTIQNNVDEQVQIPRLLLKNLVENAIKHGIKGTQKNAQIEVIAQKENETIHIKVKDSGKGFSTEKVTKGKGISVYEELFNYFNQKNQNPASLHFESTKNGTQVLISIPVNYQYQ